MTQTSPIRWTFVLSLALLILCLAAIALRAQPAYMLNYGDSLNVTVLGHPELSVQDQPVRPDGAIALPLIQEVAVKDRTVEEVTGAVTKRLLPFLTHPVVVVNVAKFRPLHVTVLGQVNHPGTFDFSEPPTLVDALASAGGVTERASRRSIKVVDPQGQHRTYNLDKLLKGEEVLPRMSEGTIVEVSEVWGPDWERWVPIIASAVTAYALLIQRH